jgi:hypothetical protein
VVYANNVNFFGENLNTINRNTKAVSESGIEASTKEMAATNQNCIHEKIKELIKFWKCLPPLR